ncbi:MAG: trypsin-like peptidase domain-containing protein [Actinomycetota bacterium]
MDDTTRGHDPGTSEPQPIEETTESLPDPWNAPSAEPTPPPTRHQPHGAEPSRRGHLSTGVVAFISAVLGAAAVVGILALLGLFSTATVDPADTPEAVTEPAGTTEPTIVQEATTEIVASPADVNIAEAVAVKVVPSVVTVEVGNLADNVLTLTGTGSGVILDNGYVVTNHHVIEDADVSRIVLQDGRTYDAEIIGSDSYTDLAVLRVDIDGLTPIEFGSTGGMVIGQLAVAVGNPLGQEGGASLTVGVISALSRTVDFGDESSLYGLLQTDAPINSGSSGGALVDAEGLLIGITSAIGVSRAGAEGIGYAIPVELVERIADEIIKTGGVLHSFIGIYGADYVETAEDGALIPAGAEIKELWDGPEGSAAGDAGFQPEDVIVAVEDTEISAMEDLVIALRLYHVGDEIDVTVNRGGELITATLTLAERPEDPEPLPTDEDYEEDNGDG